MIEAIISIKPRHVENILSGKKSVELRSRKMCLPKGSRLWLYATLPVGSVKAHAQVEFVELLPPSELWEKYGESICISKQEFDAYTREREEVVAIGLTEVRSLATEIDLESIRKYEKGFQPPQFFAKLHPGRAAYLAFEAHHE